MNKISNEYSKYHPQTSSFAREREKEKGGWAGETVTGTAAQV